MIFFYTSSDLSSQYFALLAHSCWSSYRSYRSKFIARSLFGDIRLLQQTLDIYVCCSGQWISIHWPPNHMFLEKTEPHPSASFSLSVAVSHC
jgi:hypothetical protein